MKVPVFTNLKTLVYQDRPVPEVLPGEVLVRVKYCGICGSDVHGYLNGIMIPPGTVMGHECSGVVARTGETVVDFKPGDRVVVKPIPQCGECHNCQKGQYSLCAKAFERAIGITPQNDGAFAEYVRIRYPKEMLFKLPENVTFQEAALVEPLSTSFHAIRLCRFKPGDRVVVIGAGMIGLGTLQFLKLGGAGKIICLEISPAKSELAMKMGADIVLNPLTEGADLMNKIYGLTDGIGADIVFECAGVPAAFQTCIHYVKSGGQVMLVGINDKDVAINPFIMVLKEVEMKAVLGYYDEYKYVIEFLSRKQIDTAALISDIISLPDLEEKGFNRLMSTNDMVKILVAP
jgi:(R,R)-butanediol dehydrogenase / meso-butanediol dehydrogenase / diacetyl reductase